MKLKLEHREKKKIEKKKPNPRAVLFLFLFYVCCFLGVLSLDPSLRKLLAHFAPVGIS